MATRSPRVPEAVVQAAYPGTKLTWVDAGGQSDVWRAQTASSDEAIRILVNGDSGRLAQEVAALQGLSSRYLMRFYALEAIQYQGNDLPVIRGEFIEGGTVADKLLRGTRPSEKQALECTAGVLEALVALHDANLIHRDVKPPNVALRSRAWEQPVLLDLGYIRAVTATSLTVYPGHIGTLQYMAPEQLRREPAKFRSDTFAAGLLLFELLTSEKPFLKLNETVQITDLVDRMADTGWPQAGLVASLQTDTRDLVASMLSFEPHNRPSVSRALREVRALLAQRP